MKNIYKMKSMFLSVLLMFILVNVLNAQDVVYVAADGSGDGTSWATPMGSIQDAIEAASPGTDLWIQKGTYYVPGDTIFTLKDGVSLYGGFTGTEVDPIQRVDFALGGTNETILSGDIDKNGISDAANSTRVMFGEDITSATTLSGVTITMGFADGSGNDGAGLNLDGGALNIENCNFYMNYCDDNGAGLNLLGKASPIVNNCSFIANFADDKAGAVMSNTDCNAVFTNCLFENNSADTDAGAVRAYKSSPQFINCTFVRNALAAGDGSAVDVNNSLSDATFINCAFWGNTEAGLLDEDLALSTSGTATITNCAFEGTFTAAGATATGTVDISTASPVFTNTVGTAGYLGYDAAADWSIQAGSPLINAGTTVAAPALDILMNIRDANTDIGAYEQGAAVPFKIAALTSGSGMISPDGAYVASGADQIFVITPDAGYEISSATYNAADIFSSLVDNTDGTFSYTAASVSADGTIEVMFEPLPIEYTVSISAGTGGAISPDGDISVTVTDVTLVTVTPSAGFIFADLLLNDVSVFEDVVDVTDGTYTYSLTAVGETSTLVASFSELFTLTLSVDANGSVDPVGPVQVSSEDVTDVTLSANTNYVLGTLTLGSVDVKGDAVDNADGTYTYSVTGVDADVTLAATFSEIQVNVIYLTSDGTGDGSSWASAAGDLQATMDAGSVGDEIWIAKGIYLVPTDTSFVLKNGVSLYGGFAGTEANKDERSKFRMGEANETKLSADIDGNGFLTGGNAPRVIFGEFISSLTTIDGFTITGGFSDIAGSNGAGIKLRASSPNISNCTFFDNYCDDGAAMYLYRSDDITSNPKVSNCYFIKGFANDDGGALYLASGTEAVFTNCVFANNFANDEGGAVRNFECSPRFLNCSFVYNALASVDPTGGGTYGPAVRNYQTGTPYMNTEPEFINCVFWRNQDGDATHSYEISNTSAMATAGVNVRVVNCAFMDSISSSAILIDTLDIGPADGSYLNPGFIDISGDPGYTTYNAASNWNLLETSVLIEKGSTTEVGVPTTDINGFDRGAGNDIGAFEYGSTSSISLPFAKFAEIFVYPNPSDGAFRVKLEGESIAEIAVIDMTGRLVLTDKNLNAFNEVSIDLSSQNQGVYFLKIKSESGQSSIGKVIIR